MKASTIYGNGSISNPTAYGNGKLDIEIDVAKIAYQPNSEVSPLVETVRAENQRLYIELGNFASEKKSLKQELVELWSQFETERANRSELEAELSELKQNSVYAATLSEKL